MSDWTALRLGDHATSFAGGTPDRSKPEFFGGMIPWVKSTEVNLGKIYSTEETLSDLGLRCSAAKWIPEQTVLVALYGATAAQIGFLKIRATANQAVLAIVPDTQLDSTFLFYALTAAKAKILFQAQGSGQPNLNKQIIDSLLLDTPPLPQQRKIARILTTVDNLIEKTEALIAKYQAIKQGMMHDLFTRGVDEHGHLRPPYEEAPELYKQSELGWIPKEWEAVRLGDHTTVKARLGWKGLKAEEYLEDGYIFLATPNLKAYRIDFENVNYISKWRYDESPEIQLQVGDVLIVKDGSTLGISNFVRCLPRPTTVNGSIAVVRTAPNLFSEFFYHFVNGQAFQKLIMLKKAGLGVPHLFQADLREFAISLPLLSEQQKIATILTKADRSIEDNQLSLERYKSLKTGLMQDLLTGKVRVKADENEEIAHV